MLYSERRYPFLIRLIPVLFCILPQMLQAQFNNRVSGAPVTLDNAPQNDTASRTNTSNWVDEKAQIHYQKRDQQKKIYTDTSIHFFHRRAFVQPFISHTGTPGSPAINLYFTPEFRTGPTLGYHVFDAYKYNPDSLVYYNTTRPYTVSTYQLGSKAEQMAHFIHTRNINPRWNVAVQYRKINAPGYFKAQRTNHDNAALSTSYIGKKLHYKLYGAIVYNKFQNDENGGIISDSLLENGNFSDRKTIPTFFEDDAYSIRRSAVTNMQREFSVSLWHHYTVGKKDTLYNEDSTQYHYTLLPRFRIAHRLRLGSEKYQFKDLRPAGDRYSDFFDTPIPAGDSVFMEQKWGYTDNHFSLNGFLGKADQQVQVSGGIGIRTDLFRTIYPGQEMRESLVSNYLTGSIRKEAVTEKQWDYEGDVLLYLAGPAAGNFILNGHIRKEISRKTAAVAVGFRQELNQAPYNHTTYANKYLTRLQAFSTESITRVEGLLQNARYNWEVGIRNYIISNYFFINSASEQDQYAATFNITQVTIGKVFRFGNWVLDNTVAWQQSTTGAPVNVPALSGRHQLSLETRIFRKRLKMATGIDIRYHSTYKPSGYSPMLNRYFYQQHYEAQNIPEAALFFNFMVKRIRVYLMGDQLQQLFSRNVIYTPGYPYPNAMIRFGFSWIMIN